MLNKGKGEREKSENGKFGKNMVFYFILIVMLVVSFSVYQKEKNASAEVGGFGKTQRKSNVSFSDLCY